MTDKKNIRRRFIAELVIKNLCIFVVFFIFYFPLSVSRLSQMPVEIVESMISLMGFLMAGAIIGAFELSYTRTNLESFWQRAIAHFTKYSLYLSIMLLMQIALIAISVVTPEYSGILVLASSPIMLSLILYDFWDALKAIEDQLRAET